MTLYFIVQTRTLLRESEGEKLLLLLVIILGQEALSETVPSKPRCVVTDKPF